MRGLIQLSSIVAVGLAFQLSERVPAFGWRIAATIGACFVLNALYVQKYPKTTALAWAMKLKPGQKVEVEGK